MLLAESPHVIVRLIYYSLSKPTQPTCLGTFASNFGSSSCALIKEPVGLRAINEGGLTDRDRFQTNKRNGRNAKRSPGRLPGTEVLLSQLPVSEIGTWPSLMEREPTNFRLAARCGRVPGSDLTDDNVNFSHYILNRWTGFGVAKVGCAFGCKSRLMRSVKIPRPTLYTFAVNSLRSLIIDS